MVASDSFMLPSLDMGGGMKQKLSMITSLFSGMMNKGGGGGGCQKKKKCKKMVCYPPKPCGGGGGGGYMKVMPGLGDKQAEREVKKYVDDHTMAMLLMKSISSSSELTKQFLGFLQF